MSVLEKIWNLVANDIGLEIHLSTLFSNSL